jgi:hypothetical protein
VTKQNGYKRARSTENDAIIRQLCADQRYKIHSTGKIETLVQRTGRLSANGTFREQVPYKNREGYCRVKYSYKDIFVHRIVFQKFIGDLNSDMVINHIDGDKTNNSVSNLEQVTHQKNMDHMVEMLQKNGETLNSKKLNFAKAEKIRSEFKSGTFTEVDLSKKYGITTPSIYAIIKLKTWKPHV